MRHRSSRQPHNIGSGQGTLRNHYSLKNVSIVMDFSRTHMKQVVTIHQSMFEKLLFDKNAAENLELAELFHDVGRTYLQISERINNRYLSQHSFQD